MSGSALATAGVVDVLRAIGGALLLLPPALAAAWIVGGRRDAWFAIAALR